MRRKEREVKDTKEIKAILERADVLRLALNNGVYPYVIPVNFGFTMEADQLILFFHGAKEGTKNQLIEKDPHVTFEVDGGHQLIQPEGEESCMASFAYESVIGHGIVEEAAEEEKEKLLTLLLAHYGIDLKKFHPGLFASTAVYKIKVESYTAKHRI